MALELIEIDAPIYWANALINGDYSELTTEEASRVQKWIKTACPPNASFAGVREDSKRFTWCYTLYDPGADCEGGEVQTYQVLTATLG